MAAVAAVAVFGHGRPASGRAGLRVLLVLLVGLAVVVGSARSASASIEVLVARPAAVRGAPLLVPVRVDAAKFGRGRAVVPLSARLADGTAIACEGLLVWPVRPPLEREALRRWANPSNELRLVDVRPPSAADGAAADAFLAIDLPPAAVEPSEIVLGRQRIMPRWLAPAPAELLGRLAGRASSIVPVGEPDALLSRPDPAAPFERFRFELGVPLRGWEAPPPLEPTSPDGLAARATTALWLAAIARVARSSEGVATEFAEALVATCADETAPAPIAAWIADPVELSAVLSLALDPAREGEPLAEAIATWLRVRSPLLMWIEAEDREQVTIALANPGTEEEIVRFAWLDAVWLDADSAPLAALVSPAEVARVRLARPTRPTSDGEPSAQDSPASGAARDADVRSALRIEHRGRARTVPVVPERLDAGPAGPTYPAFLQSLDLVSVSSGAVQRAPEALRTIASLRPRLVDWEVFAEVRCPRGPTRDDAILVAGANGTSILVRGDGSVEDPDGLIAGLGPEAAVEFKAYPDRFRVSFVLPSAWIDRVDAAAIAEIGFRRFAVEGQADAPLASVPWRRLPRTVRTDLLAR